MSTDCEKQGWKSSSMEESKLAKAVFAQLSGLPKEKQRVLKGEGGFVQIGLIWLKHGMHSCMEQ